MQICFWIFLTYPCWFLVAQDSFQLDQKNKNKKTEHLPGSALLAHAITVHAGKLGLRGSAWVALGTDGGQKGGALHGVWYVLTLIGWQAVFLNSFRNKWFAFIGLLKEYFEGHETICSLNVIFVLTWKVCQYANKARCHLSHPLLLTLLLSVVTPHLL